MKSGMKPTPFPMHVIQGTVRPERHGFEHDRPKVKIAKPKMQRGSDGKIVLGKIGQREWRRVLRVMEATGIITAADEGLLHAYCMAHELMIEDPDGFKAKPTNWSQYRLLSESLGLAPPGRERNRGN